MNVAKRSKTLTALLDLRTGPGAAILPENVQKIQLQFAFRIEGGHHGPRKFWRSYLPRLKYHNPAVAMTVLRHKDQSSPPQLSVYFRPSADSALPPQESTVEPVESAQPPQRVDIIDIKNSDENEILTQLIRITEARPCEMTEEEKETMLELAEYRKRAQFDRDAQAQLNARKAEERAMLDQAKGS